MRDWSWVLFEFVSCFGFDLPLVWFGLLGAVFVLLFFLFLIGKSRFGGRVVKADLTTMLHSLILSFIDGYCVPCFIN